MRKGHNFVQVIRRFEKSGFKPSYGVSTAITASKATPTGLFGEKVKAMETNLA